MLFGTDWPVIDPERAVAEVAELGLRPASHARMMRENALKVFTKLPRQVLSHSTWKARRSTSDNCQCRSRRVGLFHSLEEARWNSDWQARWHW